MQVATAISGLSRWWKEYQHALAPARSLAYVRIIFGALMVVSCTRFIALGWIDAQYIMPRWHFPFEGFEWVTTLGNPGMYILFGVMLTAAVGVMLGAWYRVSSIVFAVAFTYVELIDKTYYLNHYYFVSIMAFVLCLLPAHRTLSVDAWRRPHLKVDAVPRWSIDVIKIQLSIVYIFAAIAKMNSAWLFDAMPLRIWMPANDTLPVVGWLMTLWWTPWVFSWAGMLYDLTIPFWLLNRRTRPYAYVAVICFHTITGMMFQIGVFPLVMTGLTTVFFFPSTMSAEDKRTTWVPSWFSKNRVQSVASSANPTQARIPRIVGYVMGIHLLLQLLLPWRWMLTSDDLFWDENGYRFGWRVMAMEKAGTALFTVTDRETGKRGYVDNAEFLNSHQEKQMAMQPDMILQYAHKLHDVYEQRGVADPIIQAEVWVTLNGAPSKLLIDPEVDLSREQLGWERNRWVLARR